MPHSGGIIQCACFCAELAEHIAFVLPLGGKRLYGRTEIVKLVGSLQPDVQQVPAKGVPADAVRAQTAVGRRGAVFRPIGDRLWLVPAPAPRLHRTGHARGCANRRRAGGRSCARIDALPHGGHHALTVGAGFERVVLQQAGAANLAACLADDVAQLMAQQRLSVHGDEVKLSGGKGDMAALRKRVRACVRNRLAFIQLDARQVSAERIFHFGLDRRRQIDTAAGLLNLGQVGYPAQRILLRRPGGCGAAARHGTRGRHCFLLIGLHSCHPFLG